MTSQGPNISIVIPARNEAAGLRQLLPSLLGLALDAAEILVVDDGSNDDTAAVCAEYRVTRLRNHYALGNGAAIKAGARAAKGSVLIFMDADGQHEPADIPLLLEKFDEGYDMVVGARQSGSHARGASGGGQRPVQPIRELDDDAHSGRI